MSFKSLFYDLPILYRTPLFIGLLGTLIGLVGVLIAHTFFWIQFFENLHWFSSAVVGALLARQGAYLAQQRGDPDKPWWWFCFGLVAYAVGQLLWTIQVYLNWTPFPNPSDLFYVMLGPAFVIGIYTYGRHLFTLAKWRIVLLDAALLFVAMLIATMIFYLPQKGSYSWLQLSVMLTYPASFWAAASLGLIMMLTIRSRYFCRNAIPTTYRHSPSWLSSPVKHC